MPRDRHGADDPREWLARARSSLIYAQSAPPEVDREDAAYQAQQAAEKAVKAVLIHQGATFPLTHNLAALLTFVEQAGVSVPAEVRQAAALTRFAVTMRYPHDEPPLTEAELQEALAVAGATVAWAHRSIEASSE